MKYVMEKIDKLRETDVHRRHTYLKAVSRFLLEMDYSNLMKSSIHIETYWVVTTEEAIKTGQRKATHGIRKRTQLKNCPQKPTRERLRIIEVEKEINSNCWAYTATRGRG